MKIDHNKETYALIACELQKVLQAYLANRKNPFVEVADTNYYSEEKLELWEVSIPVDLDFYIAQQSLNGLTVELTDLVRKTIPQYERQKCDVAPELRFDPPILLTHSDWTVEYESIIISRNPGPFVTRGFSGELIFKLQRTCRIVSVLSPIDKSENTSVDSFSIGPVTIAHQDQLFADASSVGSASLYDRIASSVIDVAPSYEQGKIDGARDLADWIKSNNYYDSSSKTYLIIEACLNDYLQKKGI